MSSEALINKYRPIDFSECLGNEPVIKALSDAVHSPSHPHAYLLTGTTGIGKTTLARIIAKEVKATSITQIDAGTHSGVEDVRNLVEMAGFKPLSGGNHVYIIDECHACSKNAWSALLKLIEEPPPWLYICLATTEVDKVPSTIKSRAYHVVLRKLKPRDLEDLIATVSELEGWQVDSGVLIGIIQAADGSARKALSILQAGHAATDRDELSKIISQVESESNPVIVLCQALMKGSTNWKNISKLLEEIEDEDEAVSIASRYFAASLVKSEEGQAKEIYRMLRSFTETTTYDKKLHLYAAVGKILWGQLPF